MGQVGDEAGADRLANLNGHYWNGAGFFLERGDCWGHVTNNYVRLQCDQRLREGLDPGGIAGGPAMIKSKVAALHPSQFLERLMERLHHRLRFQIAFGKVRQHANSPYALGLLRARRERPRSRRAGDERYKLPAFHSSNSSARMSRDNGTSIPRALAACRLTRNSTLVGCSTGRSAILVPLRTRST